MNSLKDIIDMQGASLVDVRSRGEFESDHIPGTCNIPLDELPSRLDELKAMTTPLVLFCYSGARSAMAQQWLLNAGLKEVYNGGGIGNMKMLLV
jgi:phage shock protein E